MIGFASPAALLSASPREIMDRFELRDAEGHPYPADKLPARAVLTGAAAAKAVIRYRARKEGPWRWSEVNSHPVTDAEGTVIQAINVFRDVTAERGADERRRFLLRAVDELSSSLDYEPTLAAVARLAVPALADWCAVDIVDGDQLKRLATAHVDPDKVASVAELARRYPSNPSSKNGVHEIIRTGKPQLMSEIPRALLTAAAVDQEHLKLIEELELRSYVGVPLSVGGKVLGAITFVMAESHRVYGEDDLAFAREVADRAALAIENARLFREVEGARAAAAAQLVTEERRRHEAEEQTRFAETFVGMLGHDLRNPLNAIMMTTRLLRRIATAPNEINAVERVRTSATRMSNMVGQLLDLTRSRMARGHHGRQGTIDLCGVVSEVVDELRRAYPGPAHRLGRWHRGARGRRPRSAGAGGFEPGRQCAGARRFGAAGHGRPVDARRGRRADRAQSRAADCAGSAAFAVRALPANRRSKRTVPGPRARPVHHTADCQRARRTGRGDLHGRARHDVQRRATPFGRRCAGPTATTAGIVKQMATTKSTILVVEDEKESRDSLREILEFEGYQVETAVNGQEALDALKAGGDRICIMLLDLFMPVMDGWQVIDQLRADGRLGSTQVVIITSAPYRAPAGLLVFQKPLDLDKVIGEVQRLC